MKSVFAILILCCSLTLVAADKPTADVLGRWVGGEWPLEGKMLDTEFSHAATLTGMSRCAWSPDHVFVVCDEIVFADGKPERNLGVYSFDAQNASYHYLEVTPEGKRPQFSDLIISPDGSRWEYRGSGEVKGKKVLFRTINEHRDPDHIDWWSEYSTDDGAHWIRTGVGSEKREK